MPRGFCRGGKQILNTPDFTCFLKAPTSFSTVGLQHRYWCFLHVLLLCCSPSKKSWALNFVRPFSSYKLMFWTVVLNPQLSHSSTTRITAFFLFLPQFSFLLILSNTSLPCGVLSINLKERWFETKRAVVLLSIAIISWLLWKHLAFRQAGDSEAAHSTKQMGLEFDETVS